MPAFSLAIFDFDGTLANSFPWFCSVLDQTTEKFGLRRIAPNEIEGLRDYSSREVLERLGVPIWKVPAIATFMRSIFAEGIATIPLFPGAAEVLWRLHDARIKLALVSSNSEANVRAVLGDAAPLIDRYASGSSLWGKAGKFRATLKALGTAPSATIAIGDEVRDVEAAREAGLTAGSVTFGYNSRRALEGAKPDLLFDGYDELVKAIV